MKRTLSVLKAAAFAAAFSASAAAAEFQAGVSLLAEYDSNVLPDPDSETDSVAAWGARQSAYFGLEGHWPQRVEWQGRYDVSQSVWQDVEGFNSLMQSGYLRVSRDAAFSPELAILAADVSVDNVDFMQLMRITPALSTLVGSTWYFRGQLDLSQKTFVDYPERDAQQVYGRVLAYWLFDKTRRYLSMQLGAKREEAEQDLYSYWGSVAGLKWRQKMKSLQWTLVLKSEQRDYDEIRSSLGEPRQDRRVRISSGLEWTLGAGFSVAAEIGYDHYQSNLDVADYAQNRAEIGLSWDY
ncbi:hypothetical protein [uncultured Thalassolituus sp.]|uniref:hypothetical protein n=1 Tax=uncultured Thalassolituus sp. TaxID=285273 RepID=UPI00260C294E|nr:hypothetical protein [uncultured Thalassolituus sp.]